MGDFPSQVNVAQAPAVAGDFASKNPRSSFLAGPGGLVAGAAGVTVGRFAWATAPLDGDGAPAVVANTGFGLPSGFVHREQQALITQYLAASGNLIQPGFGLTLMISADLWVKNDGAAVALVGQKAYANFADGKVTFAATGSPTGGGTSTASTVAAGTSSVTGSIAGVSGPGATSVLTVTAVGSGTVYPGTTISGTGVQTGQQIVSQVLPLLAGEALGGVGRYNLSQAQAAAASTTVSGTYGLLTIGGTVAAGYAVGQPISGTNTVAGTSITALGTGTGAAGTYIVNNNTVVSSTAINTALNIETKYYARSSGQPGELVKISPVLNA